MKFSTLLMITLVFQSCLLMFGQDAGDTNSNSGQWRKAAVKNTAGVHRAFLFGQASFSGQLSRAEFFLDCAADGTATLHLRIADNTGFDIGDFEGEDALGSNGKLLTYSIDGGMAIPHQAGGYGATSATFDFIFTPSREELAALIKAVGKQIVFTVRSPAQKPSLTARFVLPTNSALLQEVSAPFLTGKATAPSLTNDATTQVNRENVQTINKSDFTHQKNANFDISGIGLGMPMQEALRKIGPGFRLINITMQGKDAASNAAATAQTSVIAIKGASEDVWVFEALNGSLTYIDHFVQFQDNEEPSLTDTRQRLIEKFGEPSSLPNMQSPQWIYDRSNAHIPWSKINSDMSATLGHCLTGNNQVLQISGMPVFNEVEVPQYIMQGCYVRARAMFEPDSRNPQLLKRFSLSLQDSDTVYSWIQGKGAQLTDEQKKAAEKATKNGVKAPM